jgi:hypothetical protein
LIADVTELLESHFELLTNEEMEDLAAELAKETSATRKRKANFMVSRSQ